ncbi:hypothetical protein BZA05DRAFT_414864 [Tricharina praecox]|uniref:uncharacterized protein n=1 Tax=Tricharina praecox TaxID=43433 RepID=UPI00221F3E2B|nr:uncharacterized protein BZA05DRAFT_414864 [Tricharina praecox]KAI5859142.1 hypothetical protein BZA05DRAFT_414864 [Tricharina praecox]
MLFDSNFSFAPKLSPPREREPASMRTVRYGEIVGSGDGNISSSSSNSISHDLPLSPHSMAIASPGSRSRSRATFSTGVNEPILQTMKFFKRRSADTSNDKSKINKDFYSSAVPMDLKHAKPLTISVPPRKSTRRAPSQPPRQPPPPPPPSQQQRPPMLRLEPSSRPLPAVKTQEINRSLLSPLHSKRSRQNSQTSDSGIQMLVNFLNDDSDSDEEEDECYWTGHSYILSLQQQPKILNNINHSDLYFGRLYIFLHPQRPLSFNEDDFPTSKRGSVASSKRPSFNDDNFTAPKRGATSDATSLPSSRRSSATTFFCRGSRNSVLSRNSIGLGSIAASDIDLEEGLENNTHFPGMEELKKQISWLALRGSRSYESEEEAEDVEDDSENYHHHLSSMVPPNGKTSTKTSARSPSRAMPTSIPLYAFPLPPTGTVMQTPAPRRARRRTASSECIVLEALEEMRLADQKASFVPTPTPTPTVAKVSKRKPRHSTNNPRIVGEDSWETALVGDTAAWDRMLDASDFNSYA